MRLLVLTIWIGCVASTFGEQCVIQLVRGMVTRLLGPNQAALSCDNLWSNLLLSFNFTRQDLVACQDGELLVHPPEPYFSDCQQRLDSAKRDAEADRRAFTAKMQKKIQVNQWEADRYVQESDTIRNQLTRLRDELRSTYRSLVLMSVQGGASKQALKYYHYYLEGQPPGQLLSSIIAAVYSVPEHAHERFEYLLDFARKVPGNSVRLAFYHQITAELRRHPEQRDSYLAMIAALDLGKLAFLSQNADARQLYLGLFNPALKRLQAAVIAGSYDEIVTFATAYPDHFEQIANQLSTLESEAWNQANFERLLLYPNRLPLAKQRLEAFRMMLLQINQRNKHDFAPRLTRVAKELDKCESFVKSGSKTQQSDLEKLVAVKRMFATRDANRDYDHYLQESKKIIE